MSNETERWLMGTAYEKQVATEIGNKLKLVDIKRAKDAYQIVLKFQELSQQHQ